MNNARAKRLMELHSQGYVIMIRSPYVDSPVSSIYEEDGDIVYDSQVFEGRSLLDVYMDDVKVLKEVEDWDADVPGTAFTPDRKLQNKLNSLKVTQGG